MTSKLLLLVFMVCLLALVGYVRNLYEISDFLTLDFIPLPGGAENVLIGYVSMFKLFDEGYLSHLSGATYLGHLQRLPPAFIGLERPLEAYDYLTALLKLPGGEYPLLEPYLNFGIIGVIAYLPILVMLINGALGTIRQYVSGHGSAFGFLIGTTFMMLIFRTLWYGPGALVKGMVIALLVAGATYVVTKAYSSHGLTLANRRG